MVDLRGCNFPQKKALIQQLQLEREATKCPEKLCMILSAFCQLGFDLDSLMVKLQAESILNNLKSEYSYRCYLQASILSATFQCPHSQIVAVDLCIRNIISVLNSITSPANYYQALAWANIAAVAGRTTGTAAAVQHDAITARIRYKHAKVKIEEHTKFIINSYNKNHNNDGDVIHTSKVIWLLIMNMLAASRSNDSIFYLQTKIYILEIANQKSVGLSVSTGLKRDFEHNIFPSLAFAILRLSAINMKDDQLFEELSLFYNESIKDAISVNSALEIAVSGTCNQLAIAKRDSTIKKKNHEVERLVGNYSLFRPKQTFLLGRRLRTIHEESNPDNKQTSKLQDKAYGATTPERSF